MEHFPTDRRMELEATEGHASQEETTPDGSRMEHCGSYAFREFRRTWFVMKLNAHLCKSPMQMSWDGKPRPVIATPLPINTGLIPDPRRQVPKAGRDHPPGEATRTESPRSGFMPVGRPHLTT